MPSKKTQGYVVSNKNKDTVIVRVDSIKIHPRYGKRYKSSKKYASHVEGFELSLGDKVEIMETKPISKTKKWRVSSVFEKNK